MFVTPKKRSSKDQKHLFSVIWAPFSTLKVKYWIYESTLSVGLCCFIPSGSQLTQTLDALESADLKRFLIIFKFKVSSHTVDYWRLCLDKITWWKIDFPLEYVTCECLIINYLRRP